MNKPGEYTSALKVQGAIPQPPGINPEVGRGGLTRKQRRKHSVDEYVAGILAGDKSVLSQAITLVESSLPEHFEIAQSIIQQCLPHSSNSLRIGVTGAPGSGKSSFIEAFGLYLTGNSHKLAVLTIDPSSEESKGSILGDKTRMERLSVHPNAFIRPTPASGFLGGVASKTGETIILCEAAGFDIVLIETTGVGQSETTVHSMVDFFLLLMLAGAGDDLQAIKRGIMEMADLIAITKADGTNTDPANQAVGMYKNALKLFPPKTSGWIPRVITCSALENRGMAEIMAVINEYMILTRNSGYFNENRKQQSVIRMHNTITGYLKNSFYDNDNVRSLLPELERQLSEGTITSYQAAISLLNYYFKR